MRTRHEVTSTSPRTKFSTTSRRFKNPDLVVREMTACTRAPKSILEIGPGGLALTLPREGRRR